MFIDFAQNYSIKVNSVDHDQTPCSMVLWCLIGSKLFVIVNFMGRHESITSKTVYNDLLQKLFMALCL